MRGKRLDQAVIDRIIELNRAGNDCKVITSILESDGITIPYRTVARNVKRLELSDNTRKVDGKEKEEIKRLNLLGVNDTEIGRRLGRTQSVIRRHRADMGLISPGIEIPPEKISQIGVLYEHGFTYNQISERLIVSVSSIKKFAKKLGLETRRELTESERNRIRQLNGEGYNDVMIAEEMGRSLFAVWTHRTDMNLPDVSDSDISKKVMDKKRKRKRILDIGTRDNYKGFAYRTRAASLGWPDRKLGEAVILYVLEQFGEQDEEQTLKKYAHKREVENWKTYSINVKTLRDYMVVLRKEDLVERTTQWRSTPIRHKLTGNAYSFLLARTDHTVRGSTRDFTGVDAEKMYMGKLEDRVEYEDDFGSDYDDEAEADQYFS